MRRLMLLMAFTITIGCTDSAPQKLDPISKGGPKMDVSEGGGGTAQKGKAMQPVPPSEGFKP